MLKKPDGRSAHIDPQINRGSQFDGGSEMRVSRVRLLYSNRRIDGFVLKEPVGVNLEQRQAFVHELLKKWQQLRDINTRRRHEGKTTFTLPRTVRLLEDNEHCGLLVTDLSRTGTREIFDLKELLYGHHIPPEAWADIRRQIERDIEIAQEEGIKLDNGPSCIDPWLVVNIDGKYTVFLSDIGMYTRFYTIRNHNDVAQRILNASTANILRALQKIDQVISETTES